MPGRKRGPRKSRLKPGCLVRRCEEIQACVEQWHSWASGFRISLLELGGGSGMALKSLLGTTKSRMGLLGALARLKERSLWKRQVNEFVSRLEITYGPDGWCVGCQVLVFHTVPLEEAHWRETWIQACLDAGLVCGEVDLRFSPAPPVTVYLADDRHPTHQTIWDLEQRAFQGDFQAQHLLQEYYLTVERTRVHSFSQGLSPLIRAEQSQDFFPPLDRG